MFKKEKDKELDYSSLNDMIHTGKKFVNIAYFLLIVSIVLIGTFILKEWKIFRFIGEFLSVISPIFIGFIIAWLFDPLVKKLEEKKIPRILACIITYLGFLGLLFLIIYLLIPTLVGQIKDFIDVIPGITVQLKDAIENMFKSFDGATGRSLLNQVYATIEGLAKGLTENLPNTLFEIGKSVVNGGVSFVLGIMIGFYMLFDFNKINDFILDFIPKKHQKSYNDLTKRINESLRSYLQGLLLVMLLVFVTQSIGLTLAGLQAPLIFALFCALTDVIPYFGPYIGAIPAIIVGFTMDPLVGICCIISILVVQALENNFYQPLIMGHTMKLHPVTIMLGLLIFQHFFGIVGMIVATPVIACAKVIFNFINEKFNFVDKLIPGEEK